MKVNFLTKGFKNWYGQTFLYPVIRYRRHLKNRGIDLKLFHHDSADLTDCDVLMLDNSWFRDQWLHHTDQVIEQLKAYKAKSVQLHYLDFMDSTGMPHARALPYVDRYWKSYLLKNRHQYLKPAYGHRVFTDYYHEKYQIEDLNPAYSEPISNESQLQKLGVAWSSALSNYAFRGLYQIELFKRLPITKILDFPPKFIKAKGERPHPLFCRIGSNYSRETVAYQRQQICKKLSARIPLSRVSRRDYFKELSQSRIAISPFGYGEVCYRDYEAFLSGAILIKPDMTHMETWPNLYLPNKTVLYHDWDLSDMESLIERTTQSYYEQRSIAECAQEKYKEHLIGDTAAELFCEHFRNMVMEHKKE